MARKVDPEKYEQRRLQILEAALRCFARDGFHSTSTARICSEAGISAGNLFHYFESKDAIIEAIVAEEVRTRSELFSRLQHEADVVESLVIMFRTMMSLTSDASYSRISMEVFAEALRNPRIAEILAADSRALKHEVLALLEKGRTSGQIDGTLDLDKVAVWIMALVDGAAARAALDDSFRADDQIQIFRILISRFLRPIAAEVHSEEP
jgi:TetR/AcrR family transcriptional repressor of uid operon